MNIVLSYRLTAGVMGEAPRIDGRTVRLERVEADAATARKYAEDYQAEYDREQERVAVALGVRLYPSRARRRYVAVYEWQYSPAGHPPVA